MPGSGKSRVTQRQKPDGKDINLIGDNRLIDLLFSIAGANVPNATWRKEWFGPTSFGER
jgi:hypothetical protein